jgi:hypothetical protein
MTIENNPNGGGGEPEKISLTVGGQSVEKTLDELKTLATSALSGDNQTYNLKVDGVDKAFTLEELKQKASESAGAQRRFEEASGLRAKASSGLRIQELLEELKGSDSPDEGKAKELFKLLGVEDGSISELLETMRGNQGNQGSQQRSAGAAGGTGTTDDKALINMDRLDPRIKSIVEGAEKAELTQIRQNIENSAKKGVDNDKIFAKMIEDTPEGEREALKSVLYDMMIDDVRGRILGREVYGPEMIQSSIQKIRARITNLGIPTRAPSAGPIMGNLGISDALAPEIRASEPIKRVPSTQSGYEENAVKRMQQLTFKAARKLGSSLR